MRLTTRPHLSPLDVPQARQAPRALLAQLRAADPRAELVYAGDGVWWVGDIGLPASRRLQARGVVRYLLREPLPLDPAARRAAEAQRARKLLLARCEALGFAHVASYAIQGEPDGRIARDYAERTWAAASEAEGEARFTRALDRASGDDRRAATQRALHDHTQATARANHRHATRHPVSVRSSGIPGIPSTSARSTA